MSPSHCPIAMADVASPLDILLLHPLLVILLICLLVTLPLVVLLLCHLLGFSLRRLALLSFCCTTLLASHCAGWSLSHLSSCCPLVILLFWPVVTSPLPLLLLPPFPPCCNASGCASNPHANAPPFPCQHHEYLSSKFAKLSSKSNNQPLPLLPPCIICPSPLQ